MQICLEMQKESLLLFFFSFAFEYEFSVHLPLQDNIFYLGSIHCTSNSVSGKAN